MVRYNDELIDEIRTSNDIVDVISQYVTLKKSGANYFGLCPFHREKSPSFSVSPSKQIFHCFGCGAGGNVIHFISKIEGLDFRDALETLAERAGIALPTDTNQEDSKRQALRAKVFEINEAASIYYHENLYKPTSKECQNYVKKRKLDNKTLKAFRLGYSNPSYSDLYNFLKSKGFTNEQMLASSLIIKTEKGDFVDRFRGRFMIPIQDVRGKVIAFGGRVIDEYKPKAVNSPDAKYINSPENIVYSKGRNLFGLNVAKKYDTSRLLIVEGYMDAISLYQRGITNVVASLGTALTENQGRLLRKHANQIILGYDSDGAGQAAIVRGLDILTNLGCDVRILQMEGAKDPDEYIIKYGSGRFLKLMDEAISLVEYKVKILKNNSTFNSSNDKIKFLNEIAKILVPIDNRIEQEVYIDKISGEYKISKEAIYAQINKLKYGNNNPEKALTKKPIKRETKEDTNNEYIKKENMIIALLLNEGNAVYERIKNTVSPEDFKLQQNKKIAQKMYEEFEKGKSNIENILDLLEGDEECISQVTGIMSEEFEISDTEKCIQDVINAYSREKLTSRKNEIIKLIENPELPKEEAIELEKELNELIIKLAKK
ncbi:MAG: DNA primase [Clostridia bacterium]|nr:DNA primase [Clostridia bacterium]